MSCHTCNSQTPASRLGWLRPGGCPSHTRLRRRSTMIRGASLPTSCIGRGTGPRAASGSMVNLVVQRVVLGRIDPRSGTKEEDEP
jgi:hypothetical protein